MRVIVNAYTCVCVWARECLFACPLVCVCVCTRTPASVSLFLSGLKVPGLMFAWVSLCVCVSVHEHWWSAGVCYILRMLELGDGHTGRQRDALLRSHYVRQGCGNAILGNMHVTCVPGRWLATHQWYVPVSSTRHQSGATPISFQRNGAYSGQSNNH